MMDIEKHEPEKLDAEERFSLSNDDFGLPEERTYPMPDAVHVRAAEAYFRYCPDEKKPELARSIMRKAMEYGVNIKSKTILEWAAK